MLAKAQCCSASSQWALQRGQQSTGKKGTSSTFPCFYSELCGQEQLSTAKMFCVSAFMWMSSRKISHFLPSSGPYRGVGMWDLNPCATGHLQSGVLIGKMLQRYEWQRKLTRKGIFPLSFLLSSTGTAVSGWSLDFSVPVLCQSPAAPSIWQMSVNMRPH